MKRIPLVGKHAWKGAVKRNDYALILAPDLGWVRVFWFGPDNWRLLPLDFETSSLND